MMIRIIRINKKRGSYRSKGGGAIDFVQLRVAAALEVDDLRDIVVVVDELKKKLKTNAKREKKRKPQQPTVARLGRSDFQRRLSQVECDRMRWRENQNETKQTRAKSSARALIDFDFPQPAEEE